MTCIAIPLGHSFTEYVPLEDVLYLHHEMKYVTVATKKKDYILQATIKSLDAKYGHYFVRVSDATLVPMTDVKRLSRRDHEVELHMGRRFRVSRRRFEEVKAKLDLYLTSHD